MYQKNITYRFLTLRNWSGHRFKSAKSGRNSSRFMGSIARIFVLNFFQDSKSIYPCHCHSHPCNKPQNCSAKMIIPFLQEYNDKIQGSIKNHFHEEHDTIIGPCYNPDQTAFWQSITQGDVSCCQVSDKIKQEPENKQGFIIFVRVITLWQL